MVKAHHLISRFVSLLGGSDTRIVGIIMVSAILIVAAREFAPFEVGKDQASQLEAAQRLVDGLGLTTTNDVTQDSYDIIDVPRAQFLTWWPPGFSVLVAAFLFTGLPLLASLKIIYGLTTLAGWLGWATLASRFASSVIKIGGKRFPVHLLMFFIPIFFTPKWSGTDVFLWAGIPLMLLLLFKAGSTLSTKSSQALIALAGLLFGALYAIRFSSIFLGLAAAIILLQISMPDRRTALKRYLVFALSALTIILPVILYTKIYSPQESMLPAYVNTEFVVANVSERINAVFYFLPMLSNLIFGTPLIDQITYKLNLTFVTYLSGVIWFGVIIAAPLILLEETLRTRARLKDDLALGLSILPLTLFGSILVANEYLLGVRRYYEPLALFGFLMACEILRRRVVNRWTRAAAQIVLLVFISHMVLYLPALALSSDRADYVVSSVLGYMPAKNSRYQSTSHDVGYPAHDQMFSKKESSRLKLNELYETNPNALFFVEEYSFFIYDKPHGSPIPGRTLRVFPTMEYWHHAYTSETVKLFWVVNLDTKLDFIPQDNLRVVYADEVEKTKIVESDFQAGYRFGFRADSGNQTGSGGAE